MDKLTSKQRLFCHEYLKDFNATQAAIRSGYSERSASSIANENLNKPEIKQEIDRLSASCFSAQGLSIARILAEVTSIAFSDKNSKNERLKALEILLKHKSNEPVQERSFEKSAKLILERIRNMKVTQA